LNATGSRKS